MNIIVRDYIRPDPALVKGFEGIPTGVVSDAVGRGNSMAAEIKPAWPRNSSSASGSRRASSSSTS